MILFLRIKKGKIFAFIAVIFLFSVFSTPVFAARKFSLDRESLTPKAVSRSPISQSVIAGKNIQSAAVPQGLESVLNNEGQKDVLEGGSLRDWVRTLREERYEQMPYLDRGFVQQKINVRELEEKMIFVEGGPKTLKGLVQRALEADTSMDAAKERVSLAKRRILVALRNLFPEANFEFEVADGVLNATPTNAFNYKWMLSQPIFRGGILWNTFLQEKVELQIAEREYASIQEELVKEVSKAYFEHNRALQVTYDTLQVKDRMSRFVDISRRKYDSQIISEIEQLNVESLSSQLEYDYETGKQELELARLELQRYLDLGESISVGIAPLYEIGSVLGEDFSFGGLDDPDSSLDSDDLETTLGGSDLAALVDLAYKNRAELQVEAAKLQSARLEERIRWGEMMPRADITLEMGKLGEAYDWISNEPPLFNEFRLLFGLKWNAAGNSLEYEFENNESAPSISQFNRDTPSQTTSNSFRLGLFDGLDRIAEAKEAEVSRLDQVIALEEAEKDVVRSVKQSYYDFQKARIQVRSTLQRVDYRERLTRLAEHRLSQNEIEVSEYMEHEIDLLSEISELHRALSDYFSAKAELNYAIGIRDYFNIEEKYGS